MAWLLLLLLVHVMQAGKILVYSPSVSYSHLISNGRIADTLANAGHDVVMFIPEYAESTSNFDGAKVATVIRMNNISSKFDEDMEAFGNAFMEKSNLGFAERLRYEYSNRYMCEALMARRKELEQLRRYDFDAAFAEQIDFCGIGNLLWVSTTPLMDANSYNLGVPAPPSYVPTIEENDNGDVMNFWQRAYNTYMYIGSIAIHRIGTDMITEVFRKIDTNFPDVREIAANASLCFVNADEMFDLPRPIIHKTIYIGGLGINEPKPLEKKFTAIMEKGKRGVIIISLGTIAPFQALPAKAKSGFANLVRSMRDYHFILKIDKEETTTKALFYGATNCDFIEWLPQSDILAHPRLKLFVMHGGINGLTEALLRAVPLVVIPIFADQFRNARNVEKRGVGKVILKFDLSEDTIRLAIQEILNNDRYKKNAVRMSKLMKEKPFSAEQRLVQWTSFAVENGVLDVLHVEGSRMNSIVYFNLDVIAVFIVFVCATVVVIDVLFKKLIKKVSHMKVKQS